MGHTWVTGGLCGPRPHSLGDGLVGAVLQALWRRLSLLVVAGGGHFSSGMGHGREMAGGAGDGSGDVEDHVGGGLGGLVGGFG